MRYILTLISFAALVFGNHLTRKLVDSCIPRNVCADCNCNGPRGDRGEMGDQGVQGQPGKQGPDGFAGQNGQISGDLFYGTFELNPDFNVVNTDVALNFTSAIHGPAFTYTTTQVGILQAGSYQCWYSTNTWAAVKVYMTVNGVPALNDTVFGQDVNEFNPTTIYSSFYGQAILSLQAGDLIQVRMYSSGIVAFNMNGIAPTLTMIKLT